MDHLTRVYHFRYLRQLLEVKRFLKVNPSLLPAVIYLVSSGAGLYYLTCLLSHFGFDGLKHIGLGDFLTIIFSSFWLLGAFVAFLLLLVFFIPIDRASSSIQFLSIGKFMSAMNRPFLKIPVLYGFSSSVIAIFFSANILAESQASAIKHTKSDLVEVSFNYPVNWLGKTITKLNKVKVVASTSRYVFIYHPDTKKSVVVPLGNIATIFNVKQGEE